MCLKNPIARFMLKLFFTLVQRSPFLKQATSLNRNFLQEQKQPLFLSNMFQAWTNLFHTAFSPFLSQIGSSTELLHKLCDENRIDETYEFEYLCHKPAPNQIETGIIEEIRRIWGKRNRGGWRQNSPWPTPSPVPQPCSPLPLSLLQQWHP